MSIFSTIASKSHNTEYPMSSKAPSRRNASKYAASALAITMLLGTDLAMAQSTTGGGYATGGKGEYKNQIVWFRWGAHGTNIPDTGATVTNTYQVAGRTLAITCSLNNIVDRRTDSYTKPASQFQAYAPGNWRGDGLDDMYNQGFTGSANQMSIGLVNSADKGNTSADFDCSATYGGAPYALEGLVFADAESSNSNESIGITLPQDSTFRVIERYRNDCTKDYNIVRGSNGLYTFAAPTGACDANNTSQSGPMAIGFIEGATSANFYVTGGGKQAIALGVMTYIADTGDAPASYGNPTHIPKFTWEGGEASGTTTSVFSSTFNLARPVQPDIRLGATVDVETKDLRGNGATGDDSDGIDDDDALTGTVVTDLLIGGDTYTLTGIQCTATPTAAPVYGFIDFNRNGVFDVATERSQQAMCSGENSSVDLSWEVPADIKGGPSYLRLRTAAVASEIMQPDSLANSGEVEDHAITLVTSRIQLVKNLVGRLDSSDTFTVSVLENSVALTSASTVSGPAGGNNTATTQTVPVTPGESIFLAETGPFIGYNQSIECVPTAADRSGILPTFTKNISAQQILWVYKPAERQDIVCTITNTGRTRIALVKNFIGNSSTSVTAEFSLTNSSATTATMSISSLSGQETYSFAPPNAYVTNRTQPLTITEASIPDFTLMGASCADSNSGQTGNPASFGMLSGLTVTVPSENLRPGAYITCAFTNGQNAKVELSKALPNGRYNAADQFDLGSSFAAASTRTTTTGSVNNVSGTYVASNMPLDGTPISFSELGAAGADLNNYTTTWSCSNASAVAGAQSPSGTGTSFDYTPAAGDDLTCVFTNTRKAKVDLAITKTNGVTTVVPGQNTTYVVTVRNLGPDDYTGAVVKDPVPDLPLSCPAPAPVTCTGDACPTTQQTVGSLQGSGLTLGTLVAGGTVSLSYTCTIN